MSNQNQTLGKWGEELAAKYLANKGYSILSANYRTRYGEIDLVTEHLGIIIFVEVKTRSSTQFGFPEEAVTPKKQQHLVHAAELYLQAQNQLDSLWRFDVIAIRKGPDGKPLITHFENAFA